MKLEILRFPSDVVQTLGLFTLYSEDFQELFKGVTIELPDKYNQRSVSRINEGTYKCVKRTSEKYGSHFHILDVEGRDCILIHSGNYHTHTQGCILPGETFVDINGDGHDDVTNSKATMTKLNHLLPDEFEVIIQNSECEIDFTLCGNINM